MGPLSRLGWGVAALTMALLGCRDPEAKPMKAGEPPRTAPAPDRLRVPTEALTRVELLRASPDGEHRITLQRSGDVWKLVEPVRYRVNQPAVDSIVAALAELTVIGSIPSGQAAVANQGLTPGASIRVRAWIGDRLARDFRVGRSGRDETSILPEGEHRILLVRGRCRPVFGKPLDGLRDPVVTRIDVAQLERVIYRNEHGTLVLVADPSNPGQFVPSDVDLRNFDQARATKNVGVLANLSAQGFLDPPFDRRATGLFEPDTPRATLEMTGDRSADVWIGTRTAPGLLHVRTSESEQVYLVSAHLASSLVVDGKQLERSDEAMRELREKARATGERKHVHGAPTKPPSSVPPKMLSELRGLARAQLGTL